MRKLLFLTAAVCLFSIAAFAQDRKANYSGTWTLDAGKSKLDDRSRNIESMTMTVAQTETEISVTTETKRAAPPPDAAQAMRPGGGRGGFGGGGDGKTVYSLDGKETKVEIDGPNGKMPQALKAKSDAGKLQLSKSISFSGPNGDVTITTKETWEITADGKTLTVNRESSNPRGTNSLTMVFVKK